MRRYGNSGTVLDFVASPLEDAIVKMTRKYTQRKTLPLSERFFKHIKVDPITDCWLWTGFVNAKGYGRFEIGPRAAREAGTARTVQAHRWVYELIVGFIPDGLEPDHLCHTRDKDCRGGASCPHRRCCNFNHLELVTSAENARRARNYNRNKTHCPYGHEYSALRVDRAHPKGHRQCKSCDREKDSRARIARQFWAYFEGKWGGNKYSPRRSTPY